MRYGGKLIWNASSDDNFVEKENKIKIYQVNRFLDRYLFKYGIKKANKIIVQTEYQSTFVRKYNKSAKIKIIKNFHPIPKKNDGIEKRDQIIWVSNIKNLKQPEIFIELAKIIGLKIKGTQFIMIGSPSFYPLNYQKDLELKINKVPNLKYIGKQPIEVVNDYIKASKLLVNTSKWEGFPNTYIQAWMRETPVLTINCDPDNLIKKFGLGLHSKNFENLVKDTIFLLNENNLRISMGKKAKKYAMQFHTLRNLNEMIETIFQ